MIVRCCSLHDQVPGKILTHDGLSPPPQLSGTAGVAQEGTTFGLPWISTMHMRQPPHGERCFM